MTPLESCGVCHSDGSANSATAAHALPPIEAVSNVTFAVNVADLDVTFDLAADGVPAMNYDSMQRGYRTDGTVRTNICGNASFSDPCDPALLTLTNNGGGNYTIKVLGGAAEAQAKTQAPARATTRGDEPPRRIATEGRRVTGPRAHLAGELLGKTRDDELFRAFGLERRVVVAAVLGFD